VVQVAVLNSTGGAHLEYPVAQNFSEFWFRLILLDTLGQIWGHLIRPQTFFKRVWAAKHAKTQADLNRQWRDKPVRPFLLYRQMLRVVTVPLLIGYVKRVFLFIWKNSKWIVDSFSLSFVMYYQGVVSTYLLGLPSGGDHFLLCAKVLDSPTSSAATEDRCPARDGNDACALDYFRTYIRLQCNALDPDPAYLFHHSHLRCASHGALLLVCALADE
jgi:hypothetical protein